MFATLDPTSRRLRLPYEQEVIINDTVGFIRDLPEALSPLSGRLSKRSLTAIFSYTSSMLRIQSASPDRIGR
jgi:hypothetical protein